MKTPVIYRADYVHHNGIDSRVYVRVHTTIAEDGSGREVFYAYHPARLGCGKNADTPADAVRRLVADHGRFTSCERVPFEPLEDMTISQIARLIQQDWKKVNYAAVPYLDAMHQLATVDDAYYEDSGRYVVGYFLGNAGTWRGEVAKAIKAELKRRIA